MRVFAVVGRVTGARSLGGQIDGLRGQRPLPRDSGQQVQAIVAVTAVAAVLRGRRRRRADRGFAVAGSRRMSLQLRWRLRCSWPAVDVRGQRLMLNDDG